MIKMKKMMTCFKIYLVNSSYKSTYKICPRHLVIYNTENYEKYLLNLSESIYYEYNIIYRLQFFRDKLLRTPQYINDM